MDKKPEQANALLTELTNHFFNKAAKSKRYYIFYKYSSIVLAALTTIVSSLQIFYGAQFPLWVSPLVSASATVMVALLGASNAQKNWISSRTTQQRLKTEQFLFNQQAGRYSNIADEEAIKIFSERLVQLWNEGHQQWEQHVGDE